MSITGKSLVAGVWLGNEAEGQFQAYNPLAGENISQSYFNASSADIDQAALQAAAAFPSYSSLSNETRADFIETIAEEILELGDELLDTTAAETGLPMMRLQGERMRTVNQLRMFAQFIRERSGSEIVDQADPNREPLPKPETRLRHIALGPVAVFGASNFPYAFSTAGGDTASALAAGCPVVVKGHPAHPGTSELVAQAIEKAINKCQLHSGVFSLVQSSKPEASVQLVQHPAIQAVGFTGSIKVGQLLQKACWERQQNIPFYGELGAVNPQVVMPAMASDNAQTIAQGLVDSLVMGNGQFCTNPGLWLVPESAKEFRSIASEAISKASTTALLTQGISAAYSASTIKLAQTENVELLASNTPEQPHFSAAKLFSTSGSAFLANQELHEEVFGPAALMVSYRDEEELKAIISSLEGQLTASIHGLEEDLASAQELSQQIAHKVGRLIFNQMPTGVEVCYSMNHGGPFPSSTDVRSTSVGTEAYHRFVRPICYQNAPAHLLS
ncbi:aldehyde dehydrogenase (NADP(+)) [uncultured Pseudoteredinibacter sp.]|uniref:aldehyde dehydrogenase (NADP(+)) n=1 Tax=uncultured Pseudoteredinibacter sp. TaxID=1641701 RepID=UPI002632C556|nr:aldehyde dehydrogenase (NADP(+)) [uncultured Pseudoteredinibacter sp.]